MTDIGKEEKKSKSEKMVGDYRKLNGRPEQHAGYLPGIESTVEDLAQFKYKSKMDMRSGFWKVSISKDAQELTSFCSPSGSMFR